MHCARGLISFLLALHSVHDVSAAINTNDWDAIEAGADSSVSNPCTGIGHLPGIELVNANLPAFCQLVVPNSKKVFVVGQDWLLSSHTADCYTVTASSTGTIVWGGMVCSRFAATDVPDTVAPPTPAPPTLAPSTPAPPTSSPPTPAPPTLAPPTPAPPTLAPSTPAPATVPPQTSAPTTTAPDTRAPDTLAPTQPPATAWPDTIAPPTWSPTQPPDTAQPDTIAPTLAPLTLSPDTSSPPTTPPTALPTPSPTTALPTVVPSTDAPATLAPHTLVPTHVSTTDAPRFPPQAPCGSLALVTSFANVAEHDTRAPLLFGGGFTMQATVLLEEYTYGAPIMDFSHGSDGGNVIVAQLQASGKVYVSTRTFSTTSHERLVITRDPLPLGRDVTVYVRLADGGTVSVYFDRVLQVEEETEHMTPEYGVRTVALIGASSFAEDKDINGTVQNFAFSACLVGTDAPQSTSTFENVQTGAPSSAPDTSPSSSFPVWVVAVPVAVVFCLLLLCCVWAFFFRQNQQQRFVPAIEEELVHRDDLALDSASDVADAEHMEQGLLVDSPYPTSTINAVSTAVPTTTTTEQFHNNNYVQTMHTGSTFSDTVEMLFDEMTQTTFGSVGYGYEAARARIGPFHREDVVHWRGTRLVAKGAFGAVYSGTCGDKCMAMKTLHNRTSEEDAQLTVEQVRLFRGIGEHENVVSLYDTIYVCATNTLCIFMEYLEGTTLAHIVAEEGMGEAEAARIMRQVVSGLKHLHSHDLVHRDLKGENVVLSADRSVAKLCDFGVLKEVTGKTEIHTVMTQANTIAGTPGWIAPEVMSAGAGFTKSGKPADIYSFGCTLSEALNNGRPPVVPVADNLWGWVAGASKRQSVSPELPSGLSEEARGLISQCLARDALSRPTVDGVAEHAFLQPRSSGGSGNGRGGRSQHLTRAQMNSWAQTDILGQGSFGTVFSGQLPDARQIAVKVISLKGKGSEQVREVRASAEAEFRLLLSLEHPNIVQCLGHKWESDRLEIFMELVTGGTVRNLVKRVQGGRLMDSVVRVYTKQVLSALQYLHAGAGGTGPVVHRDVKGANLLIDKEGTIKLADFGCSKLFEGDEGLGTCVGTLNWMAPEVLSGRGTAGSYGTKCDIWSLGCTVVEMLGKVPWRSTDCTSSFEVMNKINSSTGGPPLPDGLEGSLQEFLGLCLQRNPSRRATADVLLSSTFIACHDAREALLL